ncbi:MAG: hypothetical protein ABFC84_10020 [Veillonellales bacterium]
MKKIYELTLLVVMAALLFAFTGSAAASPANANAVDKVSIDVCGDGLVHAIIDKTNLAAQSNHKDIVFSSHKAIMNEVSAAAISPVLNTNGIVRAQSVTSMDGITFLGSNSVAAENPQP